MVRTRGCRKRIIWPSRVLVLSLLVQNPTVVKPKETTAEPVPGATTRARSWRRRLATNTTATLPEEILLWEIFVRLPAKYILRCRAICRYWHSLTSDADFLLTHHRHQPSLLTLIRYNTSSTDPILERGHPILGFEDYDGFKIHASCDGLLLLSSSLGSFGICNPATRQCAPLPCLTAAHRINTAALYLHRPSGEYRVLYWKGRYEDHLKAAYYILMMRRGRSPRCFGVPSDTPGIEDAMLASNLAPPVVFHNCLHWENACDAGILVFDTTVESFSLMGRRAAATRLCTRLCDMQGSIGFSCFGAGKADAKIWVLEDYEREVWSIKYHVKFPVWGLCIPLCNHGDTQHLVLSHKGDVLVYSPSYGYMFHCDNTGKLLERFQSDSWSMRLIGPWFKESLVKHDFFLWRDCASRGQLRLFDRV